MTITTQVTLSTTTDYYRHSRDGIVPHETTAAHVLSTTKTYMKGGRPYGKALLEELMERGMVGKGAVVLEVGGGEGDLARDFLTEARTRRAGLGQYIFVDLNEFLLSMQRAKTRGYRITDFVTADAVSDIPVRAESIDLLIANEVISDFPVIKNIDPEVIRQHPNLTIGIYTAEELELIQRAAEVINKFGLKIPQRKRFTLNYGAFQFLSEVYRVLKYGGTAFITELSSEAIEGDYISNIPGFLIPQRRSRYPIEIKLHGHSEHDIKFSWLIDVAEQLGFEIEFGSLADFLPLKSFSEIERRITAKDLRKAFKKYDFIFKILQFGYLIVTKR